MEKSQRKMENELQKAWAIAYVTPFCLENDLSLERLQTQRFALCGHECAFAQPSNVKPEGLTNDGDTMPTVTLLIKFEDGQLKIEETEFTKEFLGME